MTPVGGKRLRLRQRLFPHKNVSDEARDSQQPHSGHISSNISSTEKKGNQIGSSLGSSLSDSEESNGSGLWSEVYKSFTASTTSLDLQVVAKLLREQSRGPLSLTTKNGDSGTGGSREWQLCREVQDMAETKISELGKTAQNPFVRQLQHAYREIIQWVQKFVALGDMISQVDPVHIGLPWAGIRAILIVCVIHTWFGIFKSAFTNAACLAGFHP